MEVSSLELHPISETGLLELALKLATGPAQDSPKSWEYPILNTSIVNTSRMNHAERGGVESACDIPPKLEGASDPYAILLSAHSNPYIIA